MLELNDMILEEISGGFFGGTNKKYTAKIDISNKNYSKVEVERNKLIGGGNSIDVLVAQSITMGNTSAF
ncbi:MAG: hypothetical protein K2Y18_07850 [Alphaproteobacteria bacterium]|nr:hypothetical protein [Alphaproteobacteria bacterium]